MPLPAAKTDNQNQSYFHRTFRATVTAEQLLTDYEELGQWKKVAEKHNVSHAYIIMARKWLGIFSQTITKGRQYGGLNSRNTKNGGKNKCARGYIVVGRYHPDNPHERTVYEHTLVMEKYLGRPMLPGELVHHIDDNKSNNNIENLYLTDHKGHRKCDLSLQQLGYKLYKLGLIKFDKITGVYNLDIENILPKEDEND